MANDAELMLAFKRGDRSAFESLVRRHQGGLMNYFFRMLWNRQTAEDLTQEVLVRVFTHVESYQATAKFTTYLYRIARNCCIDHFRRTKRERRVASLDAENVEGQSLADALAVVADGPEEELSKKELVERVIGAISSLSEEHREVLVMSEVQGMRYADISEALGIPVGTVKSRMFNAMKRLREKLVGLEENER